MDGEQPRITLREKLEELTQRLGLRESALKEYLGEGLCRVLDIKHETTPKDACDIATQKFDEIIASLNDPRDVLAGRVAYNILDWPELEGKWLDERRKWLDNVNKTWHGDPEKKPHLPSGTFRDRMRKYVFKFVEQSIMAEWRKIAPNEEFPAPEAIQRNTRPGNSRLRRTTKLNAGSYHSAIDRRIPFIERASHCEEFAERINRGDKIVPFVGEAGNGKSRLADFAIEQKRGSNESRIDLRAHDLRTLKTDIQVGLELASQAIIGTDDDALLRAFASYICSERAPGYVLIDNLEDPALYARLVSPGSPLRSVLVITSREDVVPPDQASPLLVEPMDSGQAAALVRYLLPELIDDDLHLLVNTFGGRPLAIEHVCTGLLRDSFTTVEMVCRAFKKDADSVMGGAAAGTKGIRKEPFGWIYRQILARLRSLDKKYGTRITELLELVAFVAPEAIPEKLLQGGFTINSAFPNVDTSMVGFDVAQRDLCDRYLLRRKPDGFAIHSLTQSVLRSVLSKEGREAALCLRLHIAVHERLQEEDLSQTVDGIASELIPWLSHTFNIASGIGYLDGMCHREINFGHTLAVLIRGLGLASDGDGYLYWAFREIYPRLIGNWEEAPWMHEAYIEWLKVCFATNLFTTELYLKMLRVARSLQWKETGGEQPPLNWSADLSWIEALMQYGEYEEAGERLAYTDLHEPKTPQHIKTYVKLLLGEVRLAQGRWGEANNELTSFIEKLDDTPDELPHTVRLKMRAYRSLFEVSLQQNNLNLQQQRAQAIDNCWLEQSVGPEDPLAEAHYRYVVCRSHYNIYMRDYYKYLWDFSQQGFPPDMQNHAGALLASIAETCNLYARAGHKRIARDLLADALSVELTISPKTKRESYYIQLVDVIEDDITKKRNWFAGVRIDIAKARSIVVGINVLHDQLVTTAHLLETVACAVASGLESPYLYAECLATVVALRARARLPYDAMLREVLICFNDIGRLDRASALKQALLAWPYDCVKFRCHFWYLAIP